MHPDDPVPSTLELQPQSLKLEEDIYLRVCYTHAKYGFRNEVMPIPASMKVAKLGRLLVKHTHVQRERFMYAPNSPEHPEAVRADVGAHTKQVKLDNPAMSVKKWGLRTDDIITVRGTAVVVPVPSREDLLLVKTSSWKSDDAAGAAAAAAGRPGAADGSMFSPSSALERLQSSRAVGAGAAASKGSRFAQIKAGSSTHSLSDRLKRGASAGASPKRSGYALPRKGPASLGPGIGAAASATPLMSPMNLLM